MATLVRGIIAFSVFAQAQRSTVTKEYLLCLLPFAVSSYFRAPDLYVFAFQGR